MKKFISVFSGILAFAVLAASCGGNGGNSGNSGSENNSSSIVASDKITCFVAPEPAASVKVAKTSLEFVGDLQELYGGNLGYPQAVLVAKTDFVKKYSVWTDEFIDSMINAAEWLKTAETATVVSAVSAHLTEGLAPSLTVNNLSATAIEHSGVWFAKAAECKDEVDGFLEKLVAVNANAAKAVDKAFYYGIDGDNEGEGDGEEENPSGSSSTPVSVEIYMPDGAPALSMAKQMSEDGDADKTNYHVVEASTIATYVTGNAPKADLCILPLNLAAKILGTGETYKMLGTVTHGNLYMLSSDTSVSYTTENLSALIGKTIGVVQLQNVPGLTFKVILNAYEIPWQELTGDVAPAADKVNLRAVSPEQILPTD